MTFDYDECRQVLQQALLTVLQDQRDRIRALHQSEEIWALAYDIIPWQPFAALSLRVRDESWGSLRYDIAAWKHYEFAGDTNTSVLKRVAEYCAATVDVRKATDELSATSQELAHLLYLAAAEALLSPEVAALLQSIGVKTPQTSDTLEPTYFEFIVFDIDKVLKCNYCEVVRANRVTRRLLGRII